MGLYSPSPSLAELVYHILSYWEQCHDHAWIEVRLISWMDLAFMMWGTCKQERSSKEKRKWKSSLGNIFEKGIKKPECAASPHLLCLSWCFEGLTSPWNVSFRFSNSTFNATILKPSALITWVHLDNISRNWQLFCHSSLLHEVKFYHIEKKFRLIR